MSKIPRDRQARFHAFLRRMRAKGRSNMYGAVPYLMSAFGLDREAAFQVVCDWLDAQDAGPTPVPARRPERLAGRTTAGGAVKRKKSGTRS